MNIVKPDTWTAVDGLGRTLSDAARVGVKRPGKFVGCFYWLWYEIWQHSPARNITKIMEAHPEARNDFNHPAWGEDSHHGTPYYWNEPLYGYYQNLDEYVVRKHAEMIADAGVDVIIFDCTNGTDTWDSAYEALFKVFDEDTRIFAVFRTDFFLENVRAEFVVLGAFAVYHIGNAGLLICVKGDNTDALVVLSGLEDVFENLNYLLSLGNVASVNPLSVHLVALNRA